MKQNTLSDESRQLKEFISRVREWRNKPKLVKSFPYGIGQFLEEVSFNPKGCSLDFIQFLYENGYLEEFLKDMKGKKLK